MGFPQKQHFLHGKVCADPEMINHSFEITSDCSVSLNGTPYRINEDVTYWINITADYVTYAPVCCSCFHLASKCSIRVLDSSQVVMEDDSVISVSISESKKLYEADQYLPLPEGLGICLGTKKNAMEEPVWLKKYYNFENILELSLLSDSIILELLLFILFLAKKNMRNIPNKNLVALFFVLLVCDIIGLILPLIRRSSNEISCKTVAVSLHFFSLALCTWPVIIACDYYKIVGCRDFLE